MVTCTNCGNHKDFELLFTDKGSSVLSCEECKFVTMMIVICPSSKSGAKMPLLSYLRTQDIMKTLRKTKPTPETYKLLATYEARDKELASILGNIYYGTKQKIRGKG